MTQGKLYLYLAKRDKKGVKILSVFNGNGDFPNTRVVNLKEMNLPPYIYSSVANLAEQEKMMWELMLEGAATYQDLKDSLCGRGYTFVPTCASPMFVPYQNKIVKSEKHLYQHYTPKHDAHKSMLRKINPS